MAVEPVPYIFSKLKMNRQCHLVQGCVSPASGKASFLELEGDANMHSTLKVHNTGLTARKLRRKKKSSQLKEIEVECYTISDLTQKFGFSSIDYLSLDTEGGELKILKSIDFISTQVSVISVENNFRRPDIRNYLESSGYIYIGTFNVDEIYYFGGDELRESMQKRF